LPAEESKALSSLGNTARALVEREILLPSQQQDFTVLIVKTQEALEAYRQAADLAVTGGMPVLRLTAQLNLFGLLLDSQAWLGDEQLETAVEIWRSLQQDFNNLPPSKTVIYAQINSAEKLMDFVADKSANFANIPAGFPTVEEVNLVLEKAMEDARILGNKKAEAYAVGTLGHLRETTGEWESAEKLTQQALNLAPAYENPVTFYQYSWQLGRIRKAKSEEAEKLGNIAKADKNLYSAIAAYKNAFQTLQSLRGDLVAINPEVQFSFRDRVEPVYRQLVSLNLQATKSLIKAGKSQESQKQLKETRQVLESLQLAELNNFFQDACVDANPKAIDELAEDAAVIYPIILEDRLEVIVTLPSDRLLLNTPKDASSNGGVVSQEKLTKTLIELRAGEANASLQSPGSGTNFLPLTQQLYDWLIRPIENDLKESKIETLVFVLDGELRNIPMAVLHDGNQYLIEKYSLALAPGLQLLNPQPLSDLELGAVIAGATDAPSFQQNNLSPLPAVEDELNNIAGAIPSQKQENQNFTQENLRNLIAEVPFPVVHLATHGQFSSNIDNTFILDWDGRINVGDLDTLLKREEGEGAIELLVLSACETVAGDNRAALGLAGVAVRAGARSTLATLWTVDDRSTAEIMVEFYKQLAKGDKVSKAEALRRAQLALLKDSNYQHPFFWAPYVLVGNWQ
jgi:CHAT domain-containing protein